MFRRRSSSTLALIGFAFAVLIIALDQASKYWILYILDLDAGGAGSSIEVLPFFNLTMVWNRGISFGLFQAQALWQSLILIAFSLAAMVLAATPGIDTALVLRMSISAGAQRGLGAAFGIAAGCLLWGAVVATGLGALLAASGTVFTVVKFLGATYLVWQGVLLLRSRGVRADAPALAAGGETVGSAFAKGFLTNALNPKVGIFYLTLLPQFVPAGVEMASFSFLLASIHVAMSLLWFVLLVALTRRSVRFLQRPAVVAALDRLTGVVFLGFGLKLAVSQPA